MKHTKRCFSVCIFVLTLFVFGGCATTKSAGNGKEEGTIEITPQIVNNTDYPDQKMDANISSAIKLKFAADELLSVSDIHVDTSRCNVMLKGKVDTQAGADRAMQLGRAVVGVRSVRSSLTVKSTRTGN